MKRSKTLYSIGTYELRRIPRRKRRRGAKFQENSYFSYAIVSTHHSVPFLEQLYHSKDEAELAWVYFTLRQI